MKSNFERNKFIRNYWIIAIIIVLAAGCFAFLNWRETDWKILGLSGILIIGLSVLFFICYHQLNAVYRDIENISESMNDIIEHGEEPPEEVYREGTVGVLYSNYYKMVRALQDSKKREKDEKIFLRDIISDISHQLKTPLASLNIFMELLMDDKVQEPEKKKQILKEAENQLSRMEWMVLSMLKLARIEAGAIQFGKGEMLLLPLLTEAVESVRVLTQRKHQSIIIDCPEGTILCCDRDWLTEAIINLLKNASDYSGEHTEIRIEVEETKVYHRIYVKDEGPGIPENEIPNIFKRFYRVHQEVNPNSVGIGLSLTKSIIEGMGGSIHVKSEVGAYTWFILTFVK